jgi:hypothetical protein
MFLGNVQAKIDQGCRNLVIDSELFVYEQLQAVKYLIHVISV